MHLQTQRQKEVDGGQMVDGQTDVDIVIVI